MSLARAARYIANFTPAALTSVLAGMGVGECITSSAAAAAAAAAAKEVSVQLLQLVFLLYYSHHCGTMLGAFMRTLHCILQPALHCRRSSAPTSS
jgi:hypothetical protein